MDVHFYVYPLHQDSIPEISRYLELFSDEIVIKKIDKDNLYLLVKASPLTYQNLFGVIIYETCNGWKQHVICRIPDTLDDIVKSAELCENQNL